jgi:hypothetical protein
METASINPDFCLSVNTAGKALGVAGAFVAGPQWAIDFLIQRARPFIFSTAPPPPVAAPAIRPKFGLCVRRSAHSSANKPKIARCVSGTLKR